MRSILVKTYVGIEKTSMVLSNLYAVIGFFVIWDTMTTYISMFVLGESFGEYGLIASTMMQLFGWAWGIAMIPIEFTIFAFVAYLFSKNDRSIRIGRINIALKFLPAAALAVIIVNNVTNILIFSILQ